MTQEALAPSPLPIARIKRRSLDRRLYQEALEAGVEPLLARIIAGRAVPNNLPVAQWLDPELSALDSPAAMADLIKASKRLTQAIVDGEVIGIETDHDCDGQTSHAVIFLALSQWFKHPVCKIRSYIGHRMQEGYGLSEPLMKRMIADNPRPTLVITADNGSSDEARIKVLKEHGIDVIVTDHHAIPEEGIPSSAFAVLNPTREDCDYPDPYIAGCMVAWLLMAYQRTCLIEQGHLGAQTPSLAGLLDFVAVGTIADCVSLSRSLNNRIVTRYGMKRLSQFKRPCWRAIRDEVTDKVTSEDIGFKIAPLLNSDGRLECAFSSVSFLLSETDSEAARWVCQLVETNKKRKAIQKKITDEALLNASIIDTEEGKTLCIYLKDGHAGVHGISASRIRETFGKPTFLFSPKQNGSGLISGSGRSTDNCHLRDALQAIHDQDPTILVAFGGHHGAAGVTIKLESFKAFSQAFERAVSQQVKEPLYPYIFSDGTIEGGPLKLQAFQKMIDTLEPFGREFDAPVFELEGSLLHLRWIGATKVHASFMLQTKDFKYSCVWFFARQEEAQDLGLSSGDFVHILCSFQVDTFRVPHRLKCFVKQLVNTSRD